MRGPATANWPRVLKIQGEIVTGMGTINPETAQAMLERWNRAAKDGARFELAPQDGAAVEVK